MHKLMRYIKGYEKQALLAPLFKMLEACFKSVPGEYAYWRGN